MPALGLRFRNLITARAAYAHSLLVLATLLFATPAFPVTIDRLLIPLTGKYAISGGQEYVAVFVGYGKYEDTAFSNDETHAARIRSLIGSFATPSPR